MENDNGKGKRTTVDGATLQYDYNVEILGENPQKQRENLILLSLRRGAGVFVVLVSESIVFGGL